MESDPNITPPQEDTNDTTKNANEPNKTISINEIVKGISHAKKQNTDTFKAKVETEVEVEIAPDKSVNTNTNKCTCGKNAGGECGCRTGKGCCSGKNKLEVYDWLSDLPYGSNDPQMVEVQFKNTRKGYYLNSNNLELYKGDIVAVEATPGHDIGEVTLTGKLVKLQMLKNNYRGETKRVYRIAKPNDIEKQTEAKAKEHKTMLRAREIAEELSLAMKISDVEYQGDGNKAIFYYIADERVDFRQLIKVYASEFRVKIEMKQIGARQEAGRVGGIGPCGRELCCSSSMSNFVSVSTSAARLQDIPLNPQKLAGQCGKLKCCLNFETDMYVEAQRKLPSQDIPLETKDATFYHFKTDILSGMMSYSTDKHFAANVTTIDKDRVKEIIRMNKNGKKPSFLVTEDQIATEEKTSSHDVLEQESITRFDNSSSNNNPKRRRKNKARTDRTEANNENRDNNRPRRERQPNPNAKVINKVDRTENSKNTKENSVNTNVQTQNEAAADQNNADTVKKKKRKKYRNRNDKNRPPRNENNAGSES